MFKTMQKIFAISIALIMLMAVTCYAEDVEVESSSENPEITLVSENPETAEEATTETAGDQVKAEEAATETAGEEVKAEEATKETADEEEEMLKGDLYLFQEKIDYKRIVDGNAFLLGQDITFNSVVGGDVFILGDKVTIGSDALLYGNLFVLANKLTIEGYVYGGDLYAACAEIELTESAAINRDIRAVAGKVSLNGGVGRNVYLGVNEFSVSENTKIYGDLNYNSREAIQIPAGVVQGEIKFTEDVQTDDQNTNPFLGYLMSLLKLLATVLAVFGVMILIAPKFTNKIENSELKGILPSMLYGLIGLLITLPVVILLFITLIGIEVAFVLLAIWLLLAFSLSIPFAVISIAGFLANKVTALKKAHNILAVILTTIVVWAVTLIPYIGGLVSFLLCLYGFGYLLRTIWKSRKENTEVVKTEN